jgi:hypothetical protein
MIADGGSAVNAAATGRDSSREFLHPFQADPRPAFWQRRQDKEVFIVLKR